MKRLRWHAGRPKTKLLPHKYTGRLHSHEHTSYGWLFVILMLAMLPLLSASQLVSAVDNSGAEYNYGVYGSVPEPVPSAAPHITNLPEGKVLTTNESLVITGTCQSGTQVKIFKNGVLAGSVFCRGGNFSLPVDLFVGLNNLTTRAYNASNVSGPESTPISVRLNPNTASRGAVTSQNQFLLTSDAFYRGASSSKHISWILAAIGGQAPYTIQVSWGDGKTETIKRDSAGQFTIKHSYEKPSGGNYSVVIRGDDASGQHALLQLAAIVPGETAAASGSSYNLPGGWFTIQTTIQALATTILIVLSFWIGERYELRLLRRQARLA